uniref:Uncharacterized protein n=1 Tax=Anopheles atroparvus TaxID=41427 RepID=A0A182J9A0_ANOAO
MSLVVDNTGLLRRRPSLLHGDVLVLRLHRNRCGSHLHRETGHVRIQHVMVRHRWRHRLLWRRPSCLHHHAATVVFVQVFRLGMIIERHLTRWPNLALRNRRRVQDILVVTRLATAGLLVSLFLVHLVLLRDVLIHHSRRVAVHGRVVVHRHVRSRHEQRRSGSMLRGRMWRNHVVPSEATILSSSADHMRLQMQQFRCVLRRWMLLLLLLLLLLTCSAS